MKLKQVPTPMSGLVFWIIMNQGQSLCSMYLLKVLWMIMMNSLKNDKIGYFKMALITLKTYLCFFFFS